MNHTYRTNIGTLVRDAYDYFPVSCVDIVLNALVDDEEGNYKFDEECEAIPLEDIVNFYITQRSLARPIARRPS